MKTYFFGKLVKSAGSLSGLVPKAGLPWRKSASFFRGLSSTAKSVVRFRPSESDPSKCQIVVEVSGRDCPSDMRVFPHV